MRVRRDRPAVLGGRIKTRWTNGRSVTRPHERWPSNRSTTRPEIEGGFGVVATAHWIATAVGTGTLERGGDVFDAAVSAVRTLGVVEPRLNGPGGDVPLIPHDDLVVGTGRTAAAVAVEVGVHPTLPCRWVKRYAPGHGEAGATRPPAPLSLEPPPVPTADQAAETACPKR